MILAQYITSLFPLDCPMVRDKHKDEIHYLLTNQTRNYGFATASKNTFFRWAPPLYVLLCVCLSVCLSVRPSVRPSRRKVYVPPPQYICYYIIYQMSVPPLCICYVYYIMSVPPSCICYTLNVNFRPPPCSL